MSSTRHSILLGTSLLVISAAASAAAPVARVDNPLRVGVLADTSRGNAFTGTMQFRLTNTSTRAVKIPNWQTPLAGLNGNLFEVLLDGKKVTYTGALIKHAAPGPNDFTVLRAGETRVVTIDLSSVYDLSQSGNYSVRFKSYLQNAQTEDGRLLATRNGHMARLESAPLRLWVDGDAVKAKSPIETAARAKPGTGATVVNGVSFVGCSSTQISGAGQAVIDARGYTENSKGYLAGSTVGPRYTTWFGAYTSTRWNTAKSHYGAIDAAMDQSGGQVKINCGCNQSYFAYVFPTKPYEIFVCRAFWSAPAKGTDSKAGTLVHEMSHFNITAGTDDVVYGQSGAKNLALTDPDGALNNADSHEYFSENNPSQN